MEFSELTNKELKGILRENKVKNYSNLNKKELVKKVNQLIKAQNGGKNGKEKNGKKKKNTFKDLIGGEPAGISEGVNLKNLPNIQNTVSPPPPEMSMDVNPKILPNIQNTVSPPPPEMSMDVNPKILPNIQNTPPPPPLRNSAILNVQKASKNSVTAPPYSQYEINILKNKEEKRQLNKVIKLSVENQEKCKACTIL